MLKRKLTASRSFSSTSNEEFSTDSRIAELEKKNASLEQSLDDLRALYENLTNDQDTEIEHRRMMQLKAKNYQLERQVQLLISASDMRAEIINEVENYALQLQEMVLEDSNASSVKRWAESVINKIKQYLVYTKQAENQKYYMKSDFVSSSEEMTVQEMCKGKMQDLAYMNLSQVSMLEDKISGLYRHLRKLHLSVQSIIEPNVVNFENITKTKSLKHIQDATYIIDRLSNDLVELSMIVPSKNHYSSTSQARSDEVDFEVENHVHYELSLTSNEVLARLPSFSRNKSACEKAIRELVRAFHVQKNIWAIEKEALMEERNFYKQSHDFQVQYSRSMIKEVEQAIQQFLRNFEPSSGRNHSGPNDSMLTNIMNVFASFDSEATETNLRNLLRMLRNYSKEFQDAGRNPPPSQSSTKSRILDLRLSQDYQKFLREIDAIQGEYNLKEENLIGKKYRLEEELLKSPMFMEANL